MSKIINFEIFKGAKELDEDYPKFLGNVEKFFGTHIDMSNLFKRLYYAIRFTEGTINAIGIFKVLDAMPIDEQKRGLKFIAECLRGLADDLEGEINE